MASTADRTQNRSRVARRRVAILAAGAVLLLSGGVAAVGVPGPSAPAEPPLASPIDAASGEVSAFPMPGTVTASPQTQLSFRGVDAAGLGTVRVLGTRSGPHAGRLLPHSDDRGVSFVPDQPFLAGEKVRITTDLEIRGGQHGFYSIGIAVPGILPDLETPPVEEQGPDVPVRHFRSAPDLQPPVVEVSGPMAGARPPASPGLTAIGVKNGFAQKGPLLVDDAGEPVWFLPLDGVDARDVGVQTYRGEPVLTWWEGRMTTGYGYGEAVIMDSSYQEVARFSAGNGYEPDSHEVLLTDDGTALLVMYQPVRMDLSGIGGPSDGQVLENVVQEVEIDTGAVLFEWHSIGQVPLDESYQELNEKDARYDYVHVNSIDVEDDGNLLISARHTCALYELDRTTGSVEWRLGGRHSDFDVADDAVFLMQHDARRIDDGTITLFDNGGTCGDVTRESSRGIVLDVDEQGRTATLAREYVHPDGVFAVSQGDFQELDDGNAEVGWGSVSRWTLFGHGGEVLVDSTIPDELKISSYRARRVSWVGKPLTEPAAVVAPAQTGEAAVSVSWNGATEVASWRLVDETGAQLSSAPQSGFETVLPADPDVLATPGRLRVEALDAQGQVLGSTIPRYS